jgi:ZIP family zinc transporter
MGVAAGGMLSIIGDGIVPEPHAHGHAREATWGLMVGAAVVLTLDVVLAG